MSDKQKLLAFFEALTPAELDYLAAHAAEIKALFEATKGGS